MRDDPKIKPIQGIVGFEPNDQYESPFGVFVGNVFDHDDITAIERRDDYYGDHSVVWFDVFAGDRLVKSFNIRSVAMVRYMNGDDEAAK